MKRQLLAGVLGVVGLASASAADFAEYTGNSLKSAQHIFRLADMPAILIEYFRLNDDKARNAFTDENHRSYLIERISNGIDAYKTSYEPDLTCIVLDDGHGSVYPGAVLDRDKEHSEYWYSSRFQAELGDELFRRGYAVVQTDFDEDGLQTARLEKYAADANNFPCPGEKLYIANHVDSNPEKVNHYPHFYYTRPLGELPLDIRKEIVNLESYPVYQDKALKLTEILEQEFK